MALEAIDGKALPMSIKFGPDSVSRGIVRGRLGFSNASIGLHCRVELETSSNSLSYFVMVNGDVNHPRCGTGGSDPVVVELVLTTSNSPGLGMIVSGTHRFSFAGHTRTKSPG